MSSNSCKTGKKQAKFLETAFKPGQCGNPHGRPRKEDCFGDIAREMVGASEINLTMTMTNGKRREIALKSSQTFRHGVIAALIIESLKGDVKAAAELMNRADGKVKEQVEQTHHFGIETMTEAELEAEIARLHAENVELGAGKAKAQGESTD